MSLDRLLSMSKAQDEPYFDAKKYAQGISDTQSSKLLNQLDKTRSNIGVPKIKEESDLQDLFNILRNPLSVDDLFKADQLKINQKIDQSSKQGMKFLTYGEINNQQKLQDLLIKRKEIYDKEKNLLRNVKELKDYYDVNRRIQMQKGIYNKQFENEKRQKSLQLKLIREQIQNEKNYWLQQLDHIDRGLETQPNSSQYNFLLQKKGVDLVKNSQALNLKEIQLVRDKINQDHRKIQNMKEASLYDYTHLQDAPDITESLYLANDDDIDYRSQVKFIYGGAQLTGTNQEKLQKLSALREKLEDYSQNHGLNKAILDLQFSMQEPGGKITQHSKTQPTELSIEEKTLQEIDSLRKDYIQSGGQDMYYINNLNSLEKSFRQKQLNNAQPSLNQSISPSSNLNPSYFSRMYRPHRDHSLDSTKPSHPQNSFVSASSQILNNTSHVNATKNDEITTHPIYDYLPGSFKNELLKILSENQSLKDNPSLPLLQINKNKEEVQDSEEKMLEYLRYQEAELLLQMNRMNSNSQQYAQSLTKFNEIQNMKGVVEQSILQKKVRQAAEQANENLSKRQATFLKHQNNALTQLQNERGRIPVSYSKNEGFMIRWDFLANLPIHFTQTKIFYGVFRKGDDFYTYRNTDHHDTQYESYRSNKSLIMEKEIFRDVEPYPDTVIFMELWCYGEEDQITLHREPEVLGWTVIHLFDLDNQLMTGKFKLPFYPREFNPNKLLDQEPLPYIGNQSLYVRICLPLDPILDTDHTIFIENEYFLPEIHLHKSGQVISLTQEQVTKHQKTYLKSESAFNDPRLTKSQFPPNQLALKKTQDDKTPASNQNKSQPQIGDGNKQPTPKEGQRQRPQLRFGLNLRKNQQGKEDSRPKLKTPQSKPTINIKSPANDDVDLVLKIRQFKGVNVEELKNMKIKIGLFIGNKLIQDKQKKDCLVFTSLEPINDECEFDFYHQIQIDLQLICSMYKEEELKESYVYLAYYKDKSLFGWNIAKLLEQNAVGGNFQIKSGLYKVNMIDPPGQGLPFDENKMIKNNVMAEFTIMKSSDKQISLADYNTYIPIEGLKERPKKSIKPQEKKIVKNQRWNTQIILQITQLSQFPSKENLIVQIVLLHDNAILEDVLDRQCLHRQSLIAFSSERKGEFTANFTTVFRLGTSYLMDHYEHSLDSLLYFFTFFYQNKLIGIIQYPMMKPKKKTLEIGQFKLPLYLPDTKTGKQGKKTSMQINLVINETSLQIDEIESMPSYNLNSTGEYTNKSEETIFEQLEQERGPKIKYRPISILVYKLTNIQSSFYLKIWITDNDQVLKGSKNQECMFKSPKYQQHQANVLTVTCPFLVPLEAMQEKASQSDNYQVLINILNEENEEVGWMATNLYFQQKLYVNRLFTETFKKPTPTSTPIDFKKIKKNNIKIDFEIQRGDPTKQQSKQQEAPKIKKHEEDLNKFSVVVDKILNFKEKGTFELKICLMQASDILKDKAQEPCALTSDDFAADNQVLDFDEEQFDFEINLSEIEENQDEVLLIMFLSKALGNKTPILWNFWQLFQNGQLIKGPQRKVMLAPPFQRPPFNQKKFKNTQSEIIIEIL